MSETNPSTPFVGKKAGVNLITKRDAVRRALVPVFDVLVGKHRDAVVQVSGVARPFDIHIPPETLVDAAPFGRPTRETIMATAQVLAEHECRRRGLI